MYRHVIQQSLQGCEGVANISDDIIIHGKNTAEQDRRLQRIFGEAEREESHVECREVQVPHDPDGLHGTGVKRQWYWSSQKQGKGDC